MRLIMLLSATVLLLGCTREKPPVPTHVLAAGGTSEAAHSGDPVAKGKELFASKTCSACHQMDARVVGPPLRGVVAKRGEAWTRKMIQEPTDMVENDPTAKALFEEYKTPMPDLNLSDEDTNAIVAYLKSEG